MMTMQTTDETTVRLRGHHLLCVFGYRGLGYDEAFVAGMSRVIHLLCAPQTLVEVVAGPDDLCAQCPNQHKDRCASPENTRDQAVLNASGYAVGERHRASELFAAVSARISPETLETLCAGCRWAALGYCGEGLASGQIAQGWPERVRCEVSE